MGKCSARADRVWLPLFYRFWQFSNAIADDIEKASESLSKTKTAFQMYAERFRKDELICTLVMILYQAAFGKMYEISRQIHPGDVVSITGSSRESRQDYIGVILASIFDGHASLPSIVGGRTSHPVLLLPSLRIVSVADRSLAHFSSSMTPQDAEKRVLEFGKNAIDNCFVCTIRP